MTKRIDLTLQMWITGILSALAYHFQSAILIGLAVACFLGTIDMIHTKKEE